MSTLGKRNNNPLNIRYNALNKWQGQTGENKGFCVFEKPVYGIRAGMRTIRTYMEKHGIKTVDGIISRFAPASENNTENYIQYVCRETGFARNERLIYDFKTMSLLISAMSLMESRYSVSYEELLTAYKLV